MKAILSLSGGLDSTSALHRYRDDIKKAVFFSYGSRQNREELKRAFYNTKKLDVPLQVINVEPIFKNIKSVLLSDIEIPKDDYNKDNMSKLVVPFRNGIFLSILASIAESDELDTIMLASHTGDHYLYPDCRPEFNQAMREAVKYGTANNVSFFYPFENYTKRDIVRIAVANGMDFRNTYSCYTGNEIHCGECPTCKERKKAMEGFEYLDVEYMK